MRPDGAGTDERVAAGKRPPRRASDAMEWHIFKIAAVFALVITLIWGTVYLSRRAVMPDLSNAGNEMQMQP